MLLKAIGGSLKGVAGIIVAKAVKNNRNGISFSFEGSGGENLIAIFAVPKLDGFKLFLPPALFCDAPSGAIEAALLKGTDYVLHILCYEFGRKRSRIMDGDATDIGVTNLWGKWVVLGCG